MASNYIPQVDYTSRDYASIRDNMIALIPSLLPEWTNTDASDFGITLIELFAYMGDMLNYYIDRAANEGFIATATQKSSVLSLAQLLGYTPSTATPAQVTLSFSNTSSTAQTLPALTQVATTTTVNGLNTQIIFETIAPLYLPANSSGSLIQATQGETITNEYLGDSDGSSNQVFALAQSPLLSTTSSIIVGTLVGGVPVGSAYNEIPYIIDAGSNDPSYSVTTDANDVSYINFGDGISGRIPPISSVYASYRIGGGALGNVGPGTLTYQLNNIFPGITVTNPSAATGGADAETTDSIRLNAPSSYTALNRAVSLADYGALAVRVPAVAKAIADSGSAYNNINLYMAPFGDTSIGTPGVDSYGNDTFVFNNAVTSLLSYLTDTAPATTAITVKPPTYVPINIAVQVNLLPQYRQSVVNTAVQDALNTVFNFDNTIFAENVVLSYIHNVISAIDGVSFPNVTLLTRADASFMGNLTAGSSTITTPSNMLNVAVGQYVTASSGALTIPSGTTITAINKATATITAVSSAAGVITFTASNSFVAGQTVTITNVLPSDYNFNGVIVSATSTQFTVAGTATDTYVSGGTATVVTSLTMSANATGTGSVTGASLWTSSVATSGVNNIQCAVNEIPIAGIFTVTTSGGIQS